MKHVVMAPGVVLLFCLSAAAQSVPRVETYFGYSYVRFNSAGRVPAFSSNGGAGQLVYNFNPSIAIVGDFGGYHNGEISGVSVDNTVVNFQFGPRVSFRKRKRVSPYVQTLFGGAYATASSAIQRDEFGNVVVHGSDSAFAMLAGGGVNIRLSRHIAFRPVEVDYFLTRLRNPLLDSARNQNNLRYSAGIAFLFGGEKPAHPAPHPPPATKVCPDGKTVLATATCPKLDLTLALSASRTEVCSGETVALTPSLGQNRGHVTYQWSVNGQQVSQGQQFEFGTNGLAAGTYRIGVTAGGSEYNPASADTAITVKEYVPPNGTVEANPGEVYVGGKSGLSARFQGQCGGPIRPATFTASEGAVADAEFDSSSVRFDASVHSEQRKAVIITATASDDRSSGTATTMVTVIQKATIAAIRLPDILFPAGSARVNNCGKRVLLEQLRSYFERDPGGQAVLVGHQSQNEPAPNLSIERARNAAAVITAGTGICLSVPASQVLLSAPGVAQNGVSFEPNFCSASTAGGPSVERAGQAVSGQDAMAETRRVEVWFVPSGGQLPPSLANQQTAATQAVSALGCPK